MPRQFESMEPAPGIVEARAHPHTGLRICHYKTILQTNTVLYINAQPTPPVGVWTDLTLNSLVAPFPHTLMVDLLQPTTPAVGTMRFKVWGLDQYGQFQFEETPTIPIDAVTNNYLYFAKIFSRISKVQYQAATIDATSVISMWNRFQWNAADTGAVHSKFKENMGVALFRWTRDHDRPASTRYRYEHLDPITSFEVPKVQFYRIPTGALTTHEVVIGQVASSDWEGSTDKWSLPAGGAAFSFAADAHEVEVFQQCKLAGVNR